ncbi:hypothetical protein, partial [Flavobacterium filum]|uniref:hypothetical protein n=1 Tax=Flavobacterium filum TaxID=370974 RepID=UPI0023F04E35
IYLPIRVLKKISATDYAISGSNDIQKKKNNFLGQSPRRKYKTIYSLLYTLRRRFFFSITLELKNEF